MSKNLHDLVTKIRGGKFQKLALYLPLLLVIIFANPAIYAQAQLNVSFNIQQPLCYGLPNGQITATASGGTSPYSYVWSTGAIGATISGLTAGSYSVTVTDAQSQMSVQSVILDQPGLVTASIGVSATCNSPFTLTAQGGGGVQPYKYYWTTGATTQSIIVNDGTYCVTITDKNFCGAVSCVTVDNEPLTLSATAQSVTCPDGDDGKVTANPAGGMGPYTYAWNNGATTPMIQNLSPGTYSVTVTDTKGCTATATATVANKQPLVVTLNGTQPNCVGDLNGMVFASVTGGSTPYTYLWNTGAPTQGLFGIGAGTYSVTVTDNKGCIAVKSITLEPKSKITITVVATDETCPNTNSGSVTATPSNSTGPYTYAWNTGATTPTISNQAPGIYAVTVTDVFGCTATGFDTIKAAAPFVINATGTNKTTCDTNNGSATVTVNTGLAPYTYAWNNGATTQTINNLDGGTYIVTVTDSRGCIAKDTVIITEPPAIFVDVNATSSVCPGANTGSAKAVVMGGTAPFTYNWNTGATVDSIGSLSAGVYRVTVTDASGCTAIDSATINESPVLDVNIVGNDTLCGPNATTNVTAQVSGGVPPYAFLWNTGTMTQTIIGLTPGAYSVTVTDANGCQAIDNITIVAINLTTTMTKQDALCFGQSSGYAIVDADGGTMPYTYLWNTGATLDSIGGLGIGTYRVTVTDANGCTKIDSVTITQPTDITLDITADTLLCPGEMNAFAKAVVNGGTMPYTYLWNNAATVDSIGGLTAGVYRVTVTDANGCTKVDSVTIMQSPMITLQTESTEVVCGAENTGEASVAASGGVPPYTYAWSNGGNASMIENLIGGTYTVTVTDANGCSAIAEATVRIISDFALGVVPRNVLCNGDNSGSVLVTASGGDMPYTYAWSNGASGPEVTNLTAGTYTVTVTDANGCTLNQTVNITQPSQVSASASGNNLTCAGANNGSVAVTVSGGTAPYTYAWNSGQTTAQVTGLPAGTYTVTVTDSNFCTTTTSVTITQPSQLIAIINSTNIICNGEETGSAIVSGAGGTAPYTYLWSTGATTQNISGLAAGAYGVTVTDANQCTTTVSMSITEPPLLQLSLTANNIVCTSDQIGGVATIVTGGAQPYSYTWSNGATTPSISNLPGGTYSVTVTDANGCIISGTTGIAQIPNLQLTVEKEDISCFGADDGTATVTATGDTPPYSYVWSTGDTTATVDSLPPGTYTVTVRGTAGCIGETSVTINEPSELLLGLIKTDPSCNNGTNGQATATPSGGTAPYSYSWSNGGSTATITGLAAGTYNVTITDANECTTTGAVVIQAPDALTVTLNIAQGTCADESNGSITSTVAGGTPPYSYQWSNSQTGSSINDVSGGNYSVTVTDAKGCSTSGSITLNASVAPTCVTIIVQEEDIPGANNGIAQVIASGGTGPYSYFWEDGQTTQTATGLGIGVYSVTVTDANGCSTSCEVELKAPAKIGDFVWLDLNQNGIQDPGEPGIDGVIVIVTGVVEDVPYSDTAVTNSDGRYEFDVPPPGNYKVTFILPPGSGLIPTTRNAGSDDAKDSDIDPVTFMTQVVFIQRGDVDLTLDAGFRDICVNVTNAGTIGYDQYLCGPGNDPLKIVEITPPQGGFGEIQYLWMRSKVGGPFNDINWEPIPDSHTRDYDPGPIYETTYFIRCTRRANCPYIETNIVTVVVGNETVAEINGPSVTCEKTPVSFSATDEGSGATYQWDFGAGANPRFVNGRNATTTFSTFGNYFIQLTVIKGTCSSKAVKRVISTSTCSGLTIDANAVNNQAVIINWEVAQDGIDYEFEVEHSKDNLHFERLALVTTPHHLEGDMRHYEYMDESPKKGWNYYRVITRDYSGSPLISDIASVALYADSKLVHLYPNPVTDHLTLEILDAMNDDVQLQVINTSGIVMQTVNVPKDTQRQELDFSRMPSGTYFIKVRYGKIDVKVLKVLKP
ncbi:MAG: T9SS type A sorting domain-containing protein [Saprospiraceae bacterium]|nr:T9SS type A sorting domain-containing protein [Saprospiraceae bacterium]